MSEPVEVCEFTPEGMRIAQNYLRGIRAGGWTPLPGGLLTEHTYSQPVEPEVYVEERAFANRREAGQYLAEQLAPLGPDVSERPCLWSWLGMFYLERMAQAPTLRTSEYPEPAYLIDPKSHDSRYRSHHRLLMAYEVWTQWGEDAWLLLDEPANAMGQFTARIVHSPEIFRSKGVVRLMHTLYADRSAGKLRRGALGESRATAPPGSLPRLIDVLNQLSMTYDVYGMTEDQLLPLLPPEFDLFRPAE